MTLQIQAAKLKCLSCRKTFMKVIKEQERLNKWQIIIINCEYCRMKQHHMIMLMIV